MEQRIEKICTKCGRILKEDENFCSNCGTPAPQPQSAESSQNQNVQPPEQKKSGFKMLLIILVVILGGAMLCCLFGDSEDTEPTEQVQVEMEESEKMSALELYQTIQDGSSVSFAITGKAHMFLQEHDNLFPAKTKEDISADLVDTSITYKHIFKNDDKYGDKMMVLSNVRVNQIFEQSIGNGEYITELNVMDDNFQPYWVFYHGTLDNTFEDDYVDIVGLPLSSGSFENTKKEDTLVVVLAGSYVVPGNTLGSFTVSAMETASQPVQPVKQDGIDNYLGEWYITDYGMPEIGENGETISSGTTLSIYKEGNQYKLDMAALYHSTAFVGVDGLVLNVSGNLATTSYEEDGWNNCGDITLEFTNGELYVTATAIQMSDPYYGDAYNLAADHMHCTRVG